jgi:O-antigen/teichoic acid export membrane protein
VSLRRNALWNLLGMGAPLLVALFAIPYLLRTLEAEGFGILTLVWALIGYFSLFDFGVGRALTYELSRRSPTEPSALAPYVRAGLLITLATGMLGAVIVWGVAKPFAGTWLNIRQDWQHDALVSFLIAAVGIIPTTISSGLRGALEGLNRFAASNVNRMTVGALMFALPAWSVYLHGSHLWIATLYMVIARVVLMLVALFQLRQFVNFAGKLERTHLAPLLNYGVWITVTGVVGPLMVYGDRFFVSAAVGPELLPQYAIPQEALQRLLLIPAAFSGALLPRLAGSSINNVERLYQQYFKRVSLVMLVICCVAALFAYPGLSVWISSDFARSALPVTLMLTFGIWLNAMALVPYTVIHAMGKPRITAIFHLFELVLYILMLWILTPRYGLPGAAAAWVIRIAVDLVLLRVAVGRIFRDA